MEKELCDREVDEEESLGTIKARLQQDDAIAQQAANKTSPMPLIDQVSNKWQTEKGSAHIHGHEYAEDDERELGFCDLDDENSCLSRLRDLGRSRRARRMLAYALVFGTVALFVWVRYLRPQWVEENVLREGFLRSENGTFGIARGGEWKHGPERVMELDERLLPGGESDKHGTRRLVFVGDIHGCKKELTALLHKIGFDEKTDHLIATGDIISKGPDSPGVIDTLIRLNATSVRGNHEDRILASVKTFDPNTDISAFSSKRKAEHALLESLKKHHLRYLHTMPLILRIPSLPSASKPTKKTHSPIAEEILVVHAGLVPAVPLEKQDPYFVMNMRSLHPKSHTPSSERADPHNKSGKHNRPWIDIWNYYSAHLFSFKSISGFVGFDSTAQRGDEGSSEGWWNRMWLSTEWARRGWWVGRSYASKSRPKPQVVVYGHDSKAGLKIERWTKGLDSGCVAGGSLTAMVVDAHGKTEFSHVKCKEYW